MARHLIISFDVSDVPVEETEALANETMVQGEENDCHRAITGRAFYSDGERREHFVEYSKDWRARLAEKLGPALSHRGVGCSDATCGYLPDCAGNAGKLPPRTEEGMRIAARVRNWAMARSQRDHGDKPCDDYRCAALPGCAGREGAPLPLDTPYDYRAWQTWRERLSEKRKAFPGSISPWMEDMRPRWMAALDEEENRKAAIANDARLEQAIKRDAPSRSASLPRIWVDIVPTGHRIRAQLVIPKSDRHSVALAHRICALALDRDKHGSVGGPTFKVRQFCVELYVDCMDGNSAIVAREELEIAASITARDDAGFETHIVQRKESNP